MARHSRHPKPRYISNPPLYVQSPPLYVQSPPRHFAPINPSPPHPPPITSQATTASSSLTLFLFFFLVCHGCMAQKHGGSSEQQQRQCQLDKLRPLEPKRQLKSEGGNSEFFDENDDQLQCAGLAAIRRTIHPRGILVPSYANAPDVVYFSQGRGICGIVMPGCPETYQSFQQQRGQQGQSSGDQHQRIQTVREGDIIAVPAGTPYWCYNDGESPLVALTVMRTSSDSNQLDQNRRHFLLAGTEPGSQSLQQETNIFSGFNAQLLADGLGVSKETAQKLQKTEKQKGEILLAEKGLQVIRPDQQEAEQERQESEQEEGRQDTNGLEQAFCSSRFRQNINDPSRADAYSQGSGWLTVLNNRKLRILDAVQLSVVRGVLQQNAMTVPFWHVNAHSFLYVTKGQGRVQIVGDKGKSVFDGELHQGQAIVVPQNYVVIKQAKSQSFEWVAVKTHENPIHFSVTGKASFFRALPDDVLAESYKGLSREEARELKGSRWEDWGFVQPRSSSQQKDA